MDHLPAQHIEETISNDETSPEQAQLEKTSIIQTFKKKMYFFWSNIKKSANTFIKMIKKFYRDRKQQVHVEESVVDDEVVV